ncbi:hypothetical protein L204_103545 [Cryptococcus depauperatus]
MGEQDTVHGADYFRGWHRYKGRCGGLMVHKSSHHVCTSFFSLADPPQFDLVNFWIQFTPASKFGLGLFAVYGAENGKKSGWTRSYDRASGAKEAEDDPFTAHLEDEKGLKGLYHDDNILISIAVGRVKLMRFRCYHRDIYVFADDITIEDDISVLVYYESGVNMTCHLTAYSVSYSSADQRDRALAMTVGSAANESFKADKQFFIKELLRYTYVVITGLKGLRMNE